jgi:RNA polymerase sigma-70 factor, ECF subfamily
VGLSVDQVAALYRQHADVVYRRSLTLLGNQADAMDAVQEVYIKVLSARETFRGDSDPTTWIYRIATNHAINQLRRVRPVVHLDALPIEMHPHAATLEGATISRQMLQRLLTPLDDRDRSILFLHFFEGLDQGEVAEVLHISRRAVVKRLTKLHIQVQHFLEETASTRQEQKDD